MHRRRCTDEQILGVLLNPANAVSAHILDQRDPRYQALKCLNNTRTEEGSAAHGAQVADGLGFGKGVGSERGRTRFDDHGADAELIEQTRRTNEGLDELPGQMDPAEWNGRQAPYRCFIIPGWIIRGSAGLLSGEEGVGKSLLGQQMATSAAAYRPFLGLEIASVKSVYISCEDPLDEMWRRQEGINTALGINMNALAGRLKLVSLKGHLGNELCNIDNGRLKAAPRFKQIYRTCREFGANLVFLDNAAHFFPGNENDRHEVAAFLGLLERLAEDIDGAVILLAHPNKQFAQGNKQGNEYSGSTGWSAHVRNRLFLDWAAKNDDGTPVDDDGRLLRKSKANYGKKGEEIAFRWHEWAFSTPDTLGPNVAAQLSTTIQANSENDVYLRCLDTLTEQRRNVSHSPNAMNYAPRAMAKMTEGKGIGLKALERAHERLMHIRQILADQELWRKGPSDRHFVRGIARNPAWEGVGRSTGTPWQSGTSTPQETAKNDVWEAPWEGPWEGRGKVWEGSSQPIENACGTVDALSVHNTTYKEGAAQEAAAPSWETEPKPAASATQLPASPDATDKPDLSRVIFGPLPEDQRDPFNPADWPENDDDR
jgi:RecA-family ATPase